MSYLVMWRPDSGGDFDGLMTVPEFRTKDDVDGKAGMRLVCLRQVPFGSFAAVWLPGSGGNPWVIETEFAAFKTDDELRFKEGLRQVDVQFFNPPLGTPGGGPVDNIQHSAFTCVWRPGSGAQHWAGDLDLNQLKAADVSHAEAGLQLVLLRMQDDGRFYAVWQPGAGAIWTAPLNPADFMALDTAHRAKGFRLVDMDTKDLSTIIGVWHKRTDAMVWQDLGLAQILDVDIELRKAGLRIFKVVPHLPRIAPDFGGPVSGGLPPH